MRISSLFGETLRDPPADAEAASHQLLLRAGYVRQLAAGIFSYLPLAQRSLRKIEHILRTEMDAIGGQEIQMPVVHPSEPWKQSGRWEAIDETMVRFKDRAGRDMLLAMTHEEIVATLARSEIRSYRQLPRLVYQLQTKFRDEARPRSGLIRVREFIMKDSYSLDRDEAGLAKQYVAHYNAYFRIGARVGLPLAAVRSDVGMMGGKVAHEFMYPTPIGEDTLVLCTSCTYAANREVARFAKDEPAPSPQQPVERVHTPKVAAIDALATFLKCGSDQIAKSVFFMGAVGPERRPTLITAVVRGDMEVNLVAVQNLARAAGLRPAHEGEIRAAGIEPGFGSPVGVAAGKTLVVVDDLVAKSPNLIAGANEADYHLRNVNVGRDFTPDFVGSIAAAFEGAKCPLCGSALRLTRGVEVGNIFKLGTRYSASLGAKFLDEKGGEHPVIMGSYGIGVGRLLACVAEQHRDERGLALPITVAPYAVSLVSLGMSDRAKEAAEAVYQGLLAAGVEVLFDDRALSPGIKFSETDLLGMPLRVVVSERSLKQDQAELKLRTRSEATNVPIKDVVQAVQKEIAALLAEADERARSASAWDEEREKQLAALD